MNSQFASKLPSRIFIFTKYFLKKLKLMLHTNILRIDPLLFFSQIKFIMLLLANISALC